MKTKPILFSTPMVRAIIDGLKTQTRRIIKPQPEITKDGWKWKSSHMVIGENALPSDESPIPFENEAKYQPGDILWVRETWNYSDDLEYPYLYKQKEQDELKAEFFKRMKWKPSIFMPKEACRLFLKVTDVRVERLQDITGVDACKEGIERWVETRIKSQPTRYKVYYQDDPQDPAFYTSCPVDSFETLWQSINGKESWKQNPWVWVYSFEKTERPDNFLG